MDIIIRPISDPLLYIIPRLVLSLQGKNNNKDSVCCYLQRIAEADMLYSKSECGCISQQQNNHIHLEAFVEIRMIVR